MWQKQINYKQMKTSNQILFTALAVLIVLMTAVAIVFKTKTKDFIVNGDGNVITQERTFGSFDELVVEGGIRIEYLLGESNSLIIEADSNIIQDIETILMDRTLKITKNSSIHKQVRCKLTAPILQKISVSAGANLTSKDTIQSKDLNFIVNAGSSLSLIGNFERIVSSINAGSKVTLVGTCKEMKASLNAGSKLQSFEMETDHLIVDVNAGSNAFVNSKELEASSTGGSTIRYKEGAILKNIETSGGGSIQSKKGD